MIKGKDFIIKADTIFETEEYDIADDDVTAVVLGAKEKFLYDDNGTKTITQIGWTYTVFVPARNMTISIAVEERDCAIDVKHDSLVKVVFTNFRATFYVDRDGHLQLSCKADSAKKVA